MKFDCDRYTVLSLSIIVLVLTVGLGLIISFMHVLSIAKNKGCVNKAAVLLVLGKKLNNNLPDSEYMSRLNRATLALNANIDSKVYILGGMTGNANITESDAGKKVLMGFGINNDQIFLEKESSHTLENLKNFYNLSNNKSQKVLLVTNRYHMARSIMMAKGFKINAMDCPAEDSFKYTFTNISKIIIEAFYINFYLVGKYWAIFTNNSRIINRISTPDN